MFLTWMSRLIPEIKEYNSLMCYTNMKRCTVKNVTTAIERPILKPGLPNFSRGSFISCHFSLPPSFLDVFLWHCTYHFPALPPISLNLENENPFKSKISTLSRFFSTLKSKHFLLLLCTFLQKNRYYKSATNLMVRIVYSISIFV